MLKWNYARQSQVNWLLWSPAAATLFFNPGGFVQATTNHSDASSTLEVVTIPSGQLSQQGLSHNLDGVIVPAIIAALIVAAVVFAFFKDHSEQALCISEDESPEDVRPEEQLNLIMCHQNNRKYTYVLMFRVGSPTATFNMKTGYIDLELLGPDDATQGTPQRFATKLLPDTLCGPMCFIIGSITPLQEITGIKANHNDPRGAIFLFDFTLTDVEKDRLEEIRVFNAFLTNKPTIYRGHTLTKSDVGGEDASYYPTLPITELDNTEQVFLSAFLVAWTNLNASLMEHFDQYPGQLADDHHGSLYRSLFDSVVLSCLLAPTFAALVFVFQHRLKRQMRQQQYALNPDGSPQKEHQPSMAVPLIALLMLTGLACSGSIYLGTQATLTKSLYTYSSTLVVCVFILGLWMTLTKSIYVRCILESDPHGLSRVLVAEEKASQAPPSLNVYHKPSGIEEEMTVLFGKQISQDSKLSNDQAQSTVLKLVNPKLMGQVRDKWKKHTASGHKPKKNSLGRRASLKKQKRASLKHSIKRK